MYGIVPARPLAAGVIASVTKQSGAGDGAALAVTPGLIRGLRKAQGEGRRRRFAYLFLPLPEGEHAEGGREWEVEEKRVNHPFVPSLCFARRGKDEQFRFRGRSPRSPEAPSR